MAAAGIHMDACAGDGNKPLEIAFSLDLNGTGAFHWRRSGQQRAAATSYRPHPGFLGSFANETRSECCALSRPGKSSWFANDMGSYFDDMEIPWSRLPAFSADVMSLADQYQLTDRATKYAILLIGLTFMAFSFESLTHRPLHPMHICWWAYRWCCFYLVLAL